MSVPLASLSVSQVATLLDNAGFKGCRDGVTSNSISGLSLSLSEDLDDLKAFAPDLINLKLKELLRFIKNANDSGISIELLKEEKAIMSPTSSNSLSPGFAGASYAVIC